MSAVHLGPVEPLVFKPTGEVQEMGTGRTYPLTPMLPSFDEPCPDCGGTGKRPRPEGWDQKAHLNAPDRTCNCHDSWDACPCEENGHYPDCDCCPGGTGLCGPKDCPTCDGTGTVQRVWRAERQKRLYGDPAWTPNNLPGYLTADFCESRLAVVSWYPVTVLPVCPADEPPDEFPYIVADPPQWFYWKSGDSFYSVDDLTGDKPWAADLTPGCVVVIPGDEVRLDTPITEMMCGCDNGNVTDEYGTDQCSRCSSHCTVPLALTEGLNTVEIAR